MMISTPQPHRALQTLLLVIALLAAVGGLLLVCVPGLIVQTVPIQWQFAPLGFDLILLRFLGAVVLTLAYLAYTASRDPVRYVAFINAFAFLLIAAAAIDLYGLFVVHVAPFDSTTFVFIRSAIRLGLAIALIALRPRGVD